MLDAFRYLLYTSYYAGIMLDAFRYLLCSKLCWHNRPEPSSIKIHGIHYKSGAVVHVTVKSDQSETFLAIMLKSRTFTFIRTIKYLLRTKTKCYR